jgi:hypothetical protein
MSQSFPDLNLTNFPENEDIWENMQDISASDVPLLKQYQNYVIAGDIASAEQLINNNPSLEKKLINGNKLNRIMQGVKGVQRFFLSNVIGFIQTKQQEFQAYIDKFIDKGDYDVSKTYNKNNLVRYNNELYMALKDNMIGVNPIDDGISWRKFIVKGEKGSIGMSLDYKGGYNSATAYAVGDAVSYYNGTYTSIYYAKAATMGNYPNDTNYWEEYKTHEADMVDGKHADGILKTVEKTNLVSAINENVDKISTLTAEKVAKTEYLRTNQNLVKNSSGQFGLSNWIVSGENKIQSVRVGSGYWFQSWETVTSNSALTQFLDQTVYQGENYSLSADIISTDMTAGSFSVVLQAYASDGTTWLSNVASIYISTKEYNRFYATGVVPSGGSKLRLLIAMNSGKTGTCYVGNIKVCSGNVQYPYSQEGDIADINTVLADKVSKTNSDTFNGIPTFAGGVGGNEGGEIHLAKPTSGTSFTGDITLDVIGSSIRIFAPTTDGIKIAKIDFDVLNVGENKILTQRDYDALFSLLDGGLKMKNDSTGVYYRLKLDNDGLYLQEV